MQNIFTSCPTPFNFGFPTYFVSKSFSLTRASLTLFDIAIPPGAEKGSILEAIFTSSPITSLFVINISPWWIPILRFKWSTSLTVCWKPIDAFTASVTVSKINNKPSPISLSQVPLFFSTIGLSKDRCSLSKSEALD